MRPLVLDERTLRSLGSRDIRLRDGKGERLRNAECSNRVNAALAPGKFF